jgi:hypothetical protein
MAYNRASIGYVATPGHSAGCPSTIWYWQLTKGSLLRAIAEARPEGRIDSRQLELIEEAMAPEVDYIVNRQLSRPLCDLTRARLRRELRELGALMKQLCFVEDAPEPIVDLDGFVSWEPARARGQGIRTTPRWAHAGRCDLSGGDDGRHNAFDIG